MNFRNITVGLAGLALGLSVLVVGGDVGAQGNLAIGGRASNFGRQTIRGGFMPDPWHTSITSGGSIDVSHLSLSAGCRGFATHQPDYIVDYAQAADFVRFYFIGGGDTTLVINDAAGRWHCNDDSFGGLNPTVDISHPASGQYDIWVGSYRAGQNVRGNLYVTELRNNHP